MKTVLLGSRKFALAFTEEAQHLVCGNKSEKLQCNRKN
jgi:hypothetical protein